MKKTNKKKLLIGTSISCFLLTTTLGVSIAANKLITTNTATTSSINKQDYVEQDDLSNLPSDQDLGVIGASYGDSTDWQRCPGSDTDIDGGTSGYLSGTIDVRTTYNYYGYIRDWPALESSQAFVRYTKNQRNKSVCNADPTSGKSYNSDTKYYCNTTRTEVHVKTWVHVWWNGVSRSVFNGEVTFTGFSTPYTTSVSLDDYGTYSFGSTSYFPSEQPTSVVQDNINSNTSYRYNSYSSVTYDSWNNKEGTAQVTYTVKRAINGDGNEYTMGPYHLTVNGFKKHEPTTIANNSLSFDGVSIASVQNSDIQSKIAANYSNVIKNYWNTPSSSNISVNITDRDRGNGIVTCSVTLSGSTSTDDKGNPQSERTFDNVKFSGFTPVSESQIGSISVNLNTFFPNADTYSSHQAEIKAAIAKAVTVNPISAGDVSLTGFVDGDANNGTMKVKANIGNWIEAPSLVPAPKSMQLTISGFKSATRYEGNGQVIPVTNPGMNLVNAEAVKENVATKQAIASKIISTADGFSASDIQITSVEQDSVNRVAGTCTVKFKVINSKWVQADGTALDQSVEMTAQLSGFTPCTASDFSTTPLNMSSLNAYANAETADKLKEGGDSATALKDAIVNSISGEKSTITADQITINAGQPVLNYWEGTGTVSFVINNYLDSNGKFVSHSENNISLTGFLTPTTTLDADQTVTPADLSSIYLWQVDTKFDEIKSSIAQSIMDANIIKEAKDLSVDDIVLTKGTTDDASNSMTVNVSLTNSAAWQGGSANTNSLGTVNVTGFATVENATTTPKDDFKTTIQNAVGQVSMFTSELKESGKLGEVQSKLNELTVDKLFNFVNMNGQKSSITFDLPVLDESANTLTINYTVTNWCQDGTNEPSHPGSIVINTKTDPTALPADQTVTPSATQSIIEQAQQEQDLEAAQNKYKELMAQQIFDSIYANQLQAGKDLMTQKDKDKDNKEILLQAIKSGINVQAQKTYDGKTQITEVSYDMTEFNAKLQAMGLQGINGTIQPQSYPLPEDPATINNSNGEKSRWWIILLGTLGGLVVLGLIIILIVYAKKNRESSAKHQGF